MATTEELLDKLIRDCKKPGDLVGKNGMLNQFKEQNQASVENGESLPNFKGKQS